MGWGTCDTQNVLMNTMYWYETVVEGDHLSYLGVGNNIKVDLQEIELKVVDYNHLVQDKDQW